LLNYGGEDRGLEDRLYRLISRGIDGLCAVLRTGLYVLAVIFVAFYTKEVLVAFAGKETAATLIISVLADLKADRVFAYLVGAGGIGYGVVERQLRRRNIRRLATDKAEVEKRLLPSRTSSGLNPDGKTRREDR
jgi:hypothetical protein